MDLSRLQDLKTLIATAKNLQEPFNFFLDHFGESEEFIGYGKPTRDELLESLITAAAGEFIRGKAVVLSHLLLIKVKKQPFIHGSFMVNGRPASVIYFDDVKVGIMTLLPRSPGEHSLFARFSARQLPPEAVPSNN